MSIEEKAKRYDEAYKVAESIHRFCSDPAEIKRMEQIFPELAESDERIRKAIINVFAAHKDYEIFFGVSVKDILAWLEKQGEQKPAWSEEDEVKINRIMACLENLNVADNDILLKDVDWLKSLKGRVQSQTKQEWSEEDEKMLKDTIRFCELCGNQVSANWLKSLRPQNNITDEELAQAKKDAYNDVLDKLEYDNENPTFDDGWSAAIWYLKKRNAQPHNTWKPSDEQMITLRQVISGCSYDIEPLVEIEEYLKKLKE